MRLILLLILLTPTLALPADNTLISAAALLDVNSGKLLANPRVLISDGIITAINPDHVPPGTREISLPGMTLLPGFIDAHVHLAISDSNFHNLVLREGSAAAALRAAQSARQTLLGGFTTVRDVGQVNLSLEHVVVALGRAIDQGQVIGPDIIAAGHTLSVTGGHGDSTMGIAEGRIAQDWRHGLADGENDLVRAVRYQIKHGAKVIKITATAGVLSLEASVGAQQFSDEEIRAVVIEAARHDIKVAAHAHGAQGIKAAVLAGVASIEHGSLLDSETMKLMKKRGTYLVPTTGLLDVIELEGLPQSMQDKAHYVLPLAAKNFSIAIKAGVPIALGTDAPLIAHGKNAYEFAAMVDRGMTPLQSIQAGTRNAADLLGTKDRGALEVGMRADIVAVEGNPLEDITLLQQVTFVMRVGHVYKSPLASDVVSDR